jgi:hypothetical protein
VEVVVALSAVGRLVQRRTGAWCNDEDDGTPVPPVSGDDRSCRARLIEGEQSIPPCPDVRPYATDAAPATV